MTGVIMSRRQPRLSKQLRTPRPVGLGIELLEDRTVPSQFVVTTSTDSGAGSLRQAILDANAASGADTITFSGVSGTLTIATDLPAITGTDQLTITGPGQSALRVSGGSANRVFDIAAGAAATIADLTIGDGNAGSGAG